MERPIIPNTLADRYASTTMLNLFSPENKIVLEHELWVTIMRGQQSAGLDIPESVIASYDAVKHIVDLKGIRRRERILRHDEKARLEDFNERAGHEFAHMGLTSRDQSDNVEQMLIRQGLFLIRDRAVATLSRLANHAISYNDLVYAERSHNTQAQPSLIGKIFANKGEELLMGFKGLETLIEKYPLRGIKGAVGTQTDQLQLLGDPKKVAILEQQVAQSLGFRHILGNVGQIYPRSLDFEVVSNLNQLVCGPANLAKTFRLMAGNHQFTEGFKDGQVGSTAMPHKMNARTCERIASLRAVLSGHLTMANAIAGEQWYAGDVSDSAARRVFIPDSFFATDGLFQAMLTVLDECGFYPAVIDQELQQFIPFLTTSRLLMAAVEHGVGRETAHKIIKDHAVNAALNMRTTGRLENDLLDRLANDKRFGVPHSKLKAAISNPQEFTGNASQQISNFVSQAEQVISKYPEAAAYIPEEIL